jgi:flavin reductase (DIM6/NTAB) family NADH-FMN oxidoreductase RutF
MPSSELSALFYRAFRLHAHGVTLVTYRDANGRARGMTATSVCSVSAEPPQLLVCLHRDSTTRREIARERAFGVVLLAADQHELARMCAQPGSDKRIEDWCVADEAGHVRCPPDALASFDCEVAQLVESDTHSLCIGTITRIRLGSGETPLIYSGGQYQTTARVEPYPSPSRLYDELRDDMLVMYS